MEVERAAFPAVLPSILKHISNAHFVAFDLELSGIPTQKQRVSRQTLAERYSEVRAAAETFHILQVGLTLVEEDAPQQRYVMRSYNFNLSPLIYEGLDMERDFTYSSGAVDFLLRQNYRMDAPFSNGVLYLTRAETEVARERTRLRWDRDAIPDIKVAADNVHAVEFMSRVRSEIDAWKETKKPEVGFYDIAGRAPSSTTTASSTTELSRFERRLAHQIVRAEYPDLQTSSTGGCVRVGARSEEDRDFAQDAVQRRLKRAMFHQVGFRWLAEAIAGSAGDLSDIDIGACARQIDGEVPAKDLESFTARIDDLRDALRRRKPVLIGHNCLLDLVYFYRNFYGDLPETVEQFQEAIHAIFPLIIDTKYMATTGSNYYAFRSFQLSQLDEALSKDTVPLIDYAQDHPQYLNVSNYHEAGYDSFVTAKTFLKFAMRLDAEARQNDSSAREEEHGGQAKTEEIASEAEVPRPAAANGVFVAVEKKKKLKRKSKGSKEMAESKFFSANMYENLRTVASGPHPDTMEKPTSSSSTRDTNTATATESTGLGAGQNGGMIPQWDSDFWRTYGNKLRVYGTVEELCNLVPVDKKSSNEGEGAAGDSYANGADEPEAARSQKASVWGGIQKRIRSFI